MKKKSENPFENYSFFEFEQDSNMTFEQRLSAVREFGRKAQEIFKNKYEDINKWFTSDYDQLYLLSFCLRYFILAKKGYDEEAETGSIAFPPHYLEILQALSLSHERVYSAKPLLGNNPKKLVDDMKEVGTLIQTKLLNIPESINTEEELAAFRIRTDFMGYNLAVRNWAYYHQMKSITEDMANLVKVDFKNRYNICPVAFIQLLFILCDKMTDRINEHIEKLRSVLIQNNYIDVQEEYERVFDSVVKSERKNKDNMWKMSGKNLDNLKAMLLAHSDLRLTEIFSFTIDEMISFSKEDINREALLQIFNKISFEFGDLKTQKKEYIIFDNPIHNKPFIRIDQYTYYTSLWGLIPHLSLSILEFLLSEDDKLRDKYNDSRSKYLENKLEELFKKSFQQSKVFRGSMWKGNNGDQFENDLLIIIDSFALVIEAKAGIVTKSAKRGAPERLFKTIKELIEYPSEQALRFIKYLKENKGQLLLVTKSGHKNNIDLTQVKYFIPFGVTFYHMGPIGTNLKLIIKSNVTDKVISELAPSISYTDLQIVFDMLPTVPQKIHYMQRRRELETQVEYIGDELDLLGFYLDTGFNMLHMESEKIMLNLMLKSKELDPYIIAHAQGQILPKPELKMTQWWKDILMRLENKKIDRWTEIIYILLNTNIENQKEFERRIKETIQQTKNKELKLEHNWISFRTSVVQRQFSIVGYPYQEKYLKERDNIFQEIISKELNDNPQIKGIVIIGLNLDLDHYPYSAIAYHLPSTLFDNQFAN
jgi:hypothetical protein